MANFAIKGHPTRGREVIELLEMLGGENMYQVGARRETYIYFIDQDGIIRFIKINQILPEEFTVFTLEEFLKKFPFKVKDKVIVLSSNKKVYITDMEWRNNEIIYETLYNDECYECFVANELQSYKEKTMEGVYYKGEINCYHQDFEDKVRIRLGGDFEIKVEDGKTYVVRKKPQYPKTYEECCKILGTNSDNFLSIRNLYRDDGDEETTNYEKDLLDKFNYLWELLICRNAYWKIAGEEMGLGKPWEPDWTDNSDKYFICYLKDEIWMSNIRDCNRLFVFPTEEMRDAFKENFDKDLETCKEFL